MPDEKKKKLIVNGNEMANIDKTKYTDLLRVEAELDKLLNNGDNKIVYMKLLHQYNDIKDATQTVINAISNIEGSTIQEIHKRLNLEDSK